MDFASKLFAAGIAMVLLTWSIVSAAPFLAVMIVIYLVWLFKKDDPEEENPSE